MTANWTRCSGAAVGVRARIEEERDAPARRHRDGDRRPQDTGEPPQVQEAGGEHAPVLPADTTASASPSATARTALTSDESGFARTASAGFSAIPIAVGRRDELEAARVEAFRPVQGHLDAVCSRSKRTGDHLPRVTRSPPSASTATRGMATYGRWERSGSTSRPL